jgi:hypothetical protein
MEPENINKEDMKKVFEGLKLSREITKQIKGGGEVIPPGGGGGDWDHNMDCCPLGICSNCVTCDDCITSCTTCISCTNCDLCQKINY